MVQKSSKEFDQLKKYWSEVLLLKLLWFSVNKYSVKKDFGKIMGGLSL